MTKLGVRRRAGDQPVPVDRARVTRALYTRAGGLFVVGLSVGLATRWLDARVGPGLLRLTLANYQTLLSALVSGLITATVFAIWMRTVVTGLMTSQVSARLLSNYLDDGFQQWVLGSMLGGTGVAIAALVSLPPSGPVPVTFSLPLVLSTLVVAIATVLLALNRGVRDLSAQDIVYKLTHRGLHLVRVRQALLHAPEEDPPTGEAVAPGREVVRSVLLGWVVDIDLELLVDRLPEGSWTQLHTRPGQLLMPGEPLVTTSVDLAEEDHRQVRRAVLLGRRRRLEDDLSYLLRQMVDMACGALAAASNDTATADENIKGLGLILSELTRIGEPQRLRNVRGRWVVDEASLGTRDITKDAIDRLRVAAAGTPSASRQLLEMFTLLAAAVREADRDDILEDLREQVEQLLDGTARAELANSDVDELRAQAVRAGLHPRPGDVGRANGPVSVSPQPSDDGQGAHR